jgi:hypothetical protein
VNSSRLKPEDFQPVFAVLKSRSSTLLRALRATLPADGLIFAIRPPAIACISRRSGNLGIDWPRCHDAALLHPSCSAAFGSDC